ncbi:hypothetical protein L1O03_03755 [Corynebacterium uropygiale]|uniref:Uncharacterized protein n=1 Tax=Corynebacterium uropygiale TaxID=1775911 RepID=A0A9X1QN02_9CORY|nr:hypothetical protein [Corynebacterium uropygiale]MCF4006294.1 hypothetical protein [Corynebacterium uropygiale]
MSAFLAFLCLVLALSTGTTLTTVGVFVFAILGLIFLIIDWVRRRRARSEGKA